MSYILGGIFGAVTVLVITALRPSPEPPLPKPAPPVALTTVTLYSGGFPVRTWTTADGKVIRNSGSVVLETLEGTPVVIYGTFTIEPANAPK